MAFSEAVEGSVLDAEFHLHELYESALNSGDIQAAIAYYAAWHNMQTLGAINSIAVDHSVNAEYTTDDFASKVIAGTWDSISELS